MQVEEQLDNLSYKGDIIKDRTTTFSAQHEPAPPGWLR
jgi:hypothetical protein